MPPSMDTYDEPRTSRLFDLLKAVEVANKPKEASCSRRDTLHETSDSRCSQPLVAHDQELVQRQRRRKPPTSHLMHLLKAVEVVHEMKDAANTLHETSDAHLVAHDEVLVQSRRKPRTSRRFEASGHTILTSEQPEGAESGGDFAGLSAHPLSTQAEEGAATQSCLPTCGEAVSRDAAAAGLHADQEQEPSSVSTSPSLLLLLLTKSKCEGDEGAPVFLEEDGARPRKLPTSGSDHPVAQRQDEKKRSNDALRGLPSYCGWRYAFGESFGGFMDATA